MSMKIKLIAGAIVGVILLGLYYFFFESNYFGRKISRATGGIIAADYSAPDDAIQVLSVSINRDTNGDAAKNVTYLMKDCSVQVYEYRDGLRGMILEGRMKITQNGKAFKQQGCVPQK